ncbi:MAG: hypothetical protein JSS46_08790 [Proteobacteria bacterium]|nr:hypothetical protein [Pseudomonadota bacterium]
MDRDASVRDALCRLAIAAGFEARPFETIEHFIAPEWPKANACVILDASQLPAGSKLKDTMRQRGVDWPVIVLCAAEGGLARHDARNVGARFLLKKPVDGQALLDAVAWVTECHD